MSKIPVLLLISREMDLNVLHHSPRFQRYRFFFLAAMPYLENPSNPAGPGLQKALERKIGRVEAQYLLAHLGLAFHRYPVEFLTALLHVRSLHPRLRIGLDKGLNYVFQYLQVLVAPGPEVTSLVVRLVQNRSAFDPDREMAALAGCLC